MIEYARRLRGPATVGVLVIICFYVAVAVVYFAVLLSDGTYIATAARQAGADSVSLVWIFVVVALTLTCLVVDPPVPDADRLVKAAAIVVSVATGAGLLFWIMGLFGAFSVGAWLSALGGLVETLVKAVAAIVLWRLRRWPIAAPAPDDETQPEAAEPDQVPGRQPVWNPPEAVGLQWNRAGDAATGAAPPMLTPGGPEAVEAPQPAPKPPSRQTWSRGGIAPEDLPTEPGPEATPRSAAEQKDGRPTTIPGQRPAPDWTPSRRPE